MISVYLYHNPRILFLLSVVILSSGGLAYQSLPRLEDPVLSKRVGVITAIYPGADALLVETQLAIPLESSLQDVPEIKQVRANCRVGIASLVVELGDDISEVEPVWASIRERLEDERPQLPKAVQSLDLRVFELKAYAEIIALSWRDTDVPNLVALRGLAQELKSRIESIAGTEKVDIFGDPGEEVLVELATDVLTAMGTSTAALANQIQASLSRQPAGYLTSDSTRLSIEIDDRSQTPTDQLIETQIQFRDASGAVRLVNLGDVAQISHAAASVPEQVASVDGHRAVVVAAFVRDDFRLDYWAEDLEAVLAGFRSELPNSISAQSLQSQHQFIAQRLRNLRWSLLHSASAVVLVVLLIMGWQCTVVVALALPLSAGLVLAGMYGLNIPIHQMSVTGMIIALGLLIDNAIIIVEEVRMRLWGGFSATQAARDAVGHLAMPLFGSTLTTSLAFLPIATLPGPPGEFVGTIAVSVILAINASFLLAMTVLPAVTAFMLGEARGGSWWQLGISNRKLASAYAASLSGLLRRPLFGVCLSVALPLAGFGLAGILPEQFFPPTDRTQIQLELELPAEASLIETSVRAEKVNGFVLSQPEVKHCSWFIGGSAPTFYYNVVPRRQATPFYGQALVELQSDTQIEDFVRRLQRDLNMRFADCRLVVRQLEQGPPFDAPVEIRIFGPDLVELRRLGDRLRLTLSRLASVVHTRSDVSERSQSLALKTDQTEAALAGLRNEQLAGQLFGGLQGMSAGNIADGPRELPIRVACKGVTSMTLADLPAWPLLLPGAVAQSGDISGPATNHRARREGSSVRSSVPHTTLSTLAEVQLEAGAGTITRIDGKRVNEVKAYLTAGTLPSTVIDELSRSLEQEQFRLPPGYSLQYGGESRERDEAVRNLLAGAVLLFSLIALTLVISFRSFRIALTIVSVGGLAAGLGPAALWLFGFPFGFMAILGTMGLAGVAINDAIVVMAGIREDAAASRGEPSAMQEVVMARTRHVIATTLTTIAGFTPLVLGGGTFWPPLAITIAGGVGGATLLAVYFVPCAYRLLRTTSPFARQCS